MTTPPGWTSLSLAVLADGGLFVDGDWVETKDQDTAVTVRTRQEKTQSS